MRPDAGHRGHLGVVQLRAPDQVQHVGFAADRNPQRGLHRAAKCIARRRPQAAQAFGFARDCIALAGERSKARLIHQTKFMADRGQPRIGIVLAQLQPVFGAAGEHPVRLQGAVGNQVVDQHAQVGLVAARRPRGFVLHQTRGVDPGQQTLRRSFLVAGGAIDLAGEKQSGNRLGFQRGLEPARVEEVVFDGVAGAGDVCVFEADDAAYQGQLHVERQRGADAVRVDLRHVQAFRLDEDLVAGLLGEAHHLVLDARAVARADAFDLTRIQRAAMQRVADQLVGGPGGVGDPAAQLARMVRARAHERKHRARIVAGLLGHH